MNLELRTLVLLAIGILLQFLVGEMNHYLSPLHVYLYLGGLLITFPLLRFRYKQGFLYACLIALFHDATAPIPFGTSMILFLTAHTIVFALRSKFRREEPAAAIAVAFLLNGAIILALSVIQMPDHHFASQYWQRVVFDLFLSQAVLLLVAGWCFALQSEALKFFGIHLDHEQRQAG